MYGISRRSVDGQNINRDGGVDESKITNYCKQAYQNNNDFHLVYIQKTIISLSKIN